MTEPNRTLPVYIKFLHTELGLRRMVVFDHRSSISTAGAYSGLQHPEAVGVPVADKDEGLNGETKRVDYIEGTTWSVIRGSSRVEIYNHQSHVVSSELPSSHYLRLRSVPLPAVETCFRLSFSPVSTFSLSFPPSTGVLLI
jgi:hypothetical protein